MRYCPVVLGSNGRIRPDVVLVNGRPERHSEGSYYLEWREKVGRVRLSVGKDAQDAAARRQRKEAELRALNNGVSILEEPDDGHSSVAAAVAGFLGRNRTHKKAKDSCRIYDRPELLHRVLPQSSMCMRSSDMTC